VESKKTESVVTLKPDLPEVSAASSAEVPSLPARPKLDPAPASLSGDSYVLRRCLVSALDDVDVASQEPGMLRSVEAREGMHIRRGSLLAQLDDREAAAKLAALQAAFRRAEEKAKNDTQLRYSIAEEKVAQAEYQQGAEANERFPNAVAVSEMRHRKLAWEKATLGVEQAKFEQQIAQRDAEVAQAELEHARLAVERCGILAPWDGVVVEVKKRSGAWTTAGESLIRMVRMDRLRVSGHVEAQRVGLKDVLGQAVRIQAELERGRSEQLTGKIMFANPVQNGGEFLVFAEVDNPRTTDDWVLRPGMEVEMSIQTSQAVMARR
jgi:multidrug resistance efflux pump